jgi:hypothetical protein
MCYSAAVSYSAAAVLLPTGLYAIHQVRRLKLPYLLLAMVPIFFGIQQGFEGRVWQELDVGGGWHSNFLCAGFSLLLALPLVVVVSALQLPG